MTKETIRSLRRGFFPTHRLGIAAPQRGRRHLNIRNKIFVIVAAVDFLLWSARVQVEEMLMVHLDYSQLDLSRFAEPDRYKFLMGTVIPRPIALVTSLSREGVLNAAPFSQFVVVSVTPSLLGFVAHESENGLKDTVRNVLESEEYVINTVSERMAAQVQACSESFPRSVSEVAEVGFHTLPSTLVRPSRIAESPVHFECRLHRTAEFGHEGSRTHLIVGEILAVHCAEGVVSGHRVSHQAVNALGRIAGRSYCRTEDKFDV